MRTPDAEPEPPWAVGDPVESARRLAEWAIIEPDESGVRSTRRKGRPITAVKLLLVRLLRQYIGQMTAQQSRFNAQVAAHVVRLEERVAELEDAARRDREGPRRRRAAVCMRVDQVLCAAGPVDAVTNQALAYRALFRRWGWTGEDYAPVQAPGMTRGAIRPLHELGSGRRWAAGGPLLGLRARAGAGAGGETAEPVGVAQRHAGASTSGPPTRPRRCAASWRAAQLAELARLSGELAGVSEFQRGRAEAAVRTRGRGDPGAVRSALAGPGRGRRWTATPLRPSCSSGVWSRTSARTW